MRADTELAVRTAITSEDLAIAQRFFVEGYSIEEGVGRPGATLPSSLADTSVTVRIGSVDGVDVAVGMGHVAHGCVNLCRGGDQPDPRDAPVPGEHSYTPESRTAAPPSGGLHQRLLTPRLRTPRLR